MRSAILLLALPLCLVTAVPGRDATPAKTMPKRVTVGPNVVLEIDGEKRRVIVSAKVCLRMGPLEGLLTRAKKKEHEYILSADIDARHVHLALTLAKAKAGTAVVFTPKYQAATGTSIKVSLRYLKAGKSVMVPAREWIRDAKGKKDLDKNWVFAGSRFVPNPLDKNKSDYIANHGDIICTCNMESALLDLPVPSPKRFDARIWEANTDRIPELDTKVEVILEPVTAMERTKKK
jgi:hypothetical protein